MKKRALLFLLPFVASCGSPIVFRAYQNPEISTSYPSKKGEGFETLSEYAPIAIQGGNLPTSYSSIYNNGSRFSLPSLGRQKLLVIPMDFQEYPGEAEEIEAISQTFFGQNDADAFPLILIFSWRGVSPLLGFAPANIPIPIYPPSMGQKERNKPCKNYI